MRSAGKIRRLEILRLPRRPRTAASAPRCIEPATIRAPAVCGESGVLTATRTSAAV